MKQLGFQSEGSRKLGLVIVTTKIEIDGNVPAEILTIKGNDGPKAVYISSKRSRVNLLPALAVAAVGIIVHLAVNQKDEDKDAPIHV